MPEPDPQLWVELEGPLPTSLPVDCGTAVFCIGSCFHPRAGLRGVELLVDDRPTPAAAFAMPRPDLFRALHPFIQMGRGPIPGADPDSDSDPEVRCYRSGFWATVPIPASSSVGAKIRLAIRAELETGERLVEDLAEIDVVEHSLATAGHTAPAEPGEQRIAVCISTFNPDIELFRRQIDSIREQTDENWVCIVNDDCSRRQRYRQIEAELAGDDRFVLSRSPRRRGFYHGFERALELAPADAPLIALADQDDRWFPDKLATLRSELGEAKLIYSDQRLVDREGRVESDTYWNARANNHTNFASLLIANTVTGAASLIRREVVEAALPFPVVPGEQYHDHWLGLVAMALGDVAYVDRPLYDYVQHGEAALGHRAANAGTMTPAALRDRLSLRRVRQAFRSRAAYFRGYARLVTLAAVLEARLGERISGSKRRVLRRIRRAERSPVAFAWLWSRSLRALAGSNETLGIERQLASAIVWRQLVALDSRGIRPAKRPHDTSLATYEPKAIDHGDTGTAQIQTITEPLEIHVDDDQPTRINILVPAIDLKHLFGGYIAKFNLARRLSDGGHRVRIVTVDRTPPLPRDWRLQVESYSGLEGFLSAVEVAFARDLDAPLSISPTDRFIATTWWTAHLARAAVEQTDAERFVYLIQEYEPYTFAMGSLAALAMQSYTFPHYALFSTEMLRTFFRTHGYGVFADGEEGGDRDSISFENAITPIPPPETAVLTSRESRRLLFYARAEEHARRNMFELGLIAVCETIERGVFGPEWEFFGIGSVGERSRIPLPGGSRLEMIKRQPQGAYGAMIGSHDVGLALMLTPHPSLVPIEMASAGLLTVTNTFDTKTASAIEAISPNLIAAEPTVEQIVSGLIRARTRVDDHPARVAGAAVEWSNDWSVSFDSELIEQLGELIGRC